LKLRKYRLSLYIILLIAISSIIAVSLDTVSIYRFNFEIPEDIQELRTVGTAGRGTTLSAESLGLDTDPTDSTTDSETPETTTPNNTIKCSDGTEVDISLAETCPPGTTMITEISTDPCDGLNLPFLEWLACKAGFAPDDETLSTVEATIESNVVQCQFKSKTEVLVGGEIFDSTDVSSAFETTLSLSLTGELEAEDGNTLSDFDVEPAIQCDWTSSQSSLIVKPTILTVQVFAKDSKGVKHLTTVVTKTMEQLSINDNMLTKYSKIRIDPADIIGALDPGMYTSSVEFHVRGNFELYFEGFNEPSKVYQFAIPEKSVINYYDLTVNIEQPLVTCPAGQILKDGNCTTPPTLPPEKPLNGDVDPPTEPGFVELYFEMFNCLTVPNPGQCLDDDRFTMNMVVSVVGVFGVVLLNRQTRNKVAIE